MRRGNLIRTGLAALALTAAPLAADPITTTIVGADRDSFFRFDPPDAANQGAATTLSVGENNFSQLFRAVIAFDLSVLPVDAVITQATLLIRQSGAGGEASTGPSFELSVYRLLQDWTEADVTSTKRTATENWAATGADAVGVDRAATPTATADIFTDKGHIISNYVAWSVTDDVQFFYNNPTSNFGWVIIADDAEPIGGLVGAVTLNSTEASETSTPIRPRLMITYDIIPEPASLSLVLVGLALLVSRSRSTS